MPIKASVQVRFGESANTPPVTIEVDDRLDGFNEGKTQFEPGDTAYLLIYKPANVTVVNVVLSSGTLVDITPGMIEKSEELFFDDKDTATLSIPATALVSTVWYGRDLGTLSLQGDKVTVKAPTGGVAACKQTYRTLPAGFGVRSPTALGAVVDFPINCMITVDVN